MSRHVAPARWAQLGRGKVSDGDRARMLAHADDCRDCARARDRVLGAVDAFAAITATPAPELGWDHIRARVYWATSSERRSRERTAEFAKVRRRRWALALVPAVAAAGAAGVMIAASGGGAPDEPRPVPATAVVTPSAPAPAPTPLRGVVTLAVGRVALDRAASPTEVMAGPVAVGSALTTTDGRVAVQFGEASSFALGPRSTVTVRRFDAAAIELAIVGDGELAIEVAPRAPGQRFTVDVGDRTVEVRGTAFEVRHRDGATEVACAHGLVALIDDRTGNEVLVGKAQTLTVADRAPLAGQSAVALDASGVAALTAELGPRLPGWTDASGIDRTSAPLAVRAPVGRAVRVDGVVVGAGEIALRVMAGRHLIETEVSAGRFGAGEWVTTATGALTRVEPPPEPVVPPSGARVRRAELASAVDHGQIAACIRSLAKQGIGDTHLELEVGVDASGALGFLNVVDTDLPASMAACVRDTVAAIQFRPGQAATFRYRFNF
ncbi:MAG: FecR family protein [Deltaproteobacteria bacterium]|nr:FecR family protein [Deltaproteobacteria bacterium]